MLVKHQDRGTKYKKNQMQNYLYLSTVFIWAMSIHFFPPLTQVKRSQKHATCVSSVSLEKWLLNVSVESCSSGRGKESRHQTR